MPTFRYQAYTATGAVEAGEIDAVSTEDALKLLTERGLFPFSTEDARLVTASSKTGSLLSLLQPLALRDYADLTRDLSVLLQAGLPLDEALRVVAGQAEGSLLGKLAHDLLDSLVGGAALSTALERHAKSAPPYLANLIRAGEARGSLGPTLADLARFLEARVELQARIRSALTYPLVLAATAIMAVFVIIGFLVPALMPLFSETGAQAPTALLIAEGVGAVVSSYWWLILGGALCALLGGRAVMRRPSARMFFDHTVLRAPLFGSIAVKTNIAVLARTLGMLLRNGVALIQALKNTAPVVPNAVFSQALSAAAEQVKEGRRLGQALAGTEHLPTLAVRFITIGEESGKLDEMLLHLADISDKEAQRQIEKVMTLLTPALTIVIGIIVGGLILSVMQAILSVNQLAIR